jgi:4-amino-4-deoxy-L-arabinose transferase-like glycosyltransferase
MMRGVSLPILVIGLLGALYAALAFFALHGFPFSGDEYSAYLQAELFAHHALHAPAPSPAELFWVDHVIVGPTVVSQYPPGTSALLTLGLWAHVPWLVTPIEAMMAVGLTWWTARAELGWAAGWVALLVLGLSPLFVLQAATFYSHAAATMWLAAALACFSVWNRRGSSLWLVLVGAMLGAGFLTRPLDALVVGAALLVLRSPRVIAWVALGGAPFGLAHFAYQAAQFGSPFSDGYHAYQPTFEAIYGASTAASNFSIHHFLSGEEQFYHLDVFRSFLLDGALAGSALVAVVGAYAIGREHAAWRLRTLLLAVVALLSFLLLWVIADPDDGVRSRYLSTALLSVAFLAAAGWKSAREAIASRVGERGATIVAVIAVALAPIQVGSYLVGRLPQQWVREGLYDAVAKAKLDNGVIIVRADHPTRYARNGPFFDRPVLYVAPSRKTPVSEVALHFPGRAIYEAFEGREWAIKRWEGLPQP